jgi:hypothetical protein
VDAVVTAFDVAGKVFADEAIEQGAEHVLLEIPAVDSTAHIVGDLPDPALQFGALLNACHAVIPVFACVVEFQLPQLSANQQHGQAMYRRPRGEGGGLWATGGEQALFAAVRHTLLHANKRRGASLLQLGQVAFVGEFGVVHRQKIGLVADGKFHIRHPLLLQAQHRIAVLLCQLGKTLVQALVAGAGQRRQQCTFAGKVAKRRGSAHAQGFGQLAQGKADFAVLLDVLQCRVQQRVAQVAVVIGGEGVAHAGTIAADADVINAYILLDAAIVPRHDSM